MAYDFPLARHPQAPRSSSGRAPLPVLSSAATCPERVLLCHLRPLPWHCLPSAFAGCSNQGHFSHLPPQSCQMSQACPTFWPLFPDHTSARLASASAPRACEAAPGSADRPSELPHTDPGRAVPHRRPRAAPRLVSHRPCRPALRLPTRTLDAPSNVLEQPWLRAALLHR